MLAFPTRLQGGTRFLESKSSKPRVISADMPLRNQAQRTAAPIIPEKPTLPKLREAAARCKACDLWKKGTQTIFGEGASRPSLMLIGEQPGDKEDLAGHPFVGPAGHTFSSKDPYSRHPMP